MPTALEIVTDDTNIDSLKRADAPAIWNDFRAKAEALKLTAETLTVSNVHDTAGMRLARATRLSLREIRIAVEHKRKELGEFHLRETQRINADAKALKELIEPLEARLEDQEKFVEREEARLRDERKTVRDAECLPLLTAPLAVDLGAMPDGEYAAFLQDLKDAHAFRLERERKAAEEAAAKAKAYSEERARIIAENARLKAEAEVREAEARKERELMQQETLAQAERERQERAAIQAKADAERKAREAAEAAISAQKAAEAKKAADAAKAARKAAAAPDRNKLVTLAACVRGLDLPTMSTPSGVKALSSITSQLDELATHIEMLADTME